VLTATREGYLAMSRDRLHARRWRDEDACLEAARYVRRGNGAVAGMSTHSGVNDRRPLDTDVWMTVVTLREFDVRGALVKGSERAVVWDTLSHPQDMTCFRPLVEDCDVAIVYSHAD
jgi:hypothetical protein